MENKLEQYRAEINKIDDGIKELIIRRMETVKEVAEYKIANNMEVFQSGREAEVLKRITESEDINISNTLDVLYKTIMDTSRLYQYSVINKNNDSFQKYVESCKVKNITDNNIKIGCQGIEGAYSHQAAKKIFSDSPINFFASFKDVFDAVERGEIEYGVIPIENSNAGIVKENFDLLSKYDYYILAEIALPVSHCLLINKDADIKDITKVYSHEQALNQCGGFLTEHGFKTHVYSNTAAAARFVSDSGGREAAAIGSEFCAELYNLKVAEKNIQDSELNTTRFVVISKKLKIEQNPEKVSFIIKLPHEKGTLHRLLLKFSYYKLNLTRIESYPIANSYFDFLFFMDFEGNLFEGNTINLINSIKNEVEYFKFLGNFKIY